MPVTNFFFFIPYDTFLFSKELSIFRVVKLFIRLEVKVTKNVNQISSFFLLGKLDRIGRGGFDSGVHSAPML